MKKIFALTALCLCAFAAQAQTVTAITGTVCNVAQTACVLDNDSGQVIVVDPTPALYGGVRLPVTMTVDGVDYSGAYTSYVLVHSTNFEQLYEFTITFSPTATLTGARWLRRGGSGRGGWAWHSQYQFDTLTVY